MFATGDSSLYDEWGEPRPDYGIADILRAHRVSDTPKLPGTSERRRASGDRFAPDGHTYLRLSPEMRAKVNGPKSGDEPPVTGARHAVLKGFDETDIIPYGGTLSPLRLAADVTVPLTFIPPFPTYPPETSWMRQPKTDIPALVLSQHGSSRVAFMPADIDRRYAREHLPDHGDLLKNVVRWAVGEDLPLMVEGRGMIDCHLYKQGERLLLHLINLTSAGTWRAPVEELIPVGPIKVSLRIPGQITNRNARLLVSNATRPVTISQGRGIIEIGSILDHELLVIG